MKRILSIFFAMFMMAAFSIAGGVFLTADNGKNEKTQLKENDSSVSTMATGLWTDSGNYASSFGGGSGTSTSPYLISNAAQLARLAYLLDSSSYASYNTKTYKVTKDIDLSAHYWSPIGLKNYFSGAFKCSGYVISGLTMNTAYESQSIEYFIQYGPYYAAGLFAFCKNVNFYDMTLSNANIQFSSSSGSDLFYSGFVCAFGDSVTYHNVHVVDSYMKAQKSSARFNYIYMGGITASQGGSSTMIEKCSLLGCQIMSDNADFVAGVVGGLVGTLEDGSILDSFFNGHIDVYVAQSGGGIVGSVSGGTSSRIIGSCYYVDTSTGWLGSKDAGGIVGYISDKSLTSIKSCFVDATIAYNSSVSSYVSSTKRKGSIVGIQAGGKVYYCCWNSAKAPNTCYGSKTGGTATGYKAYSDANLPKGQASGFFSSTSYLYNSTYGRAWGNMWAFNTGNIGKGYPIIIDSAVKAYVYGETGKGSAAFAYTNVYGTANSTTTNSYASSYSSSNYRYVMKGQTIKCYNSPGAGYSFLQYLHRGNTYTASIVTFKMLNSSIESSQFVVQALFKANTYTLTYNANGGTTPMSSTKIAMGDRYGKNNIYDPTMCILEGPITRSGNIFTLNCNNTSGGYQWANFNQSFSGSFNTNTKYTVVYECLTYSGSGGFGLIFTSPDDEGPNGKTDISGSGQCGVSIFGVGVYKNSFTTKSSFTLSNLKYDFRSYCAIANGSNVRATFRISLFVGDITYNSFTYASKGSMPSGNLLPTPTRKGYSFDGWYTSASGGTRVYASTTYNTAGNSTLYAHWTLKTFSISIINGDVGMLDITQPATSWNIGNGYGTSGGGKRITVNYGATQNISVTTKPGYTFSHWSGDSTSTSSSISCTMSEEKDYTFTAHSKPNDYTVTFDPNGGEFNATGYKSTTEHTFNGSNYLNLGRTYMYTDKLYVSVEAYMDNWSRYANSAMRIISCTEDGGFNIEGYSGNIDFIAYDNGYGYKYANASKSWASLSAGWHKFEMSFDGRFLRGYLDGALIATSPEFKGGSIKYNTSNSIFVGAEATGSASTPESNGFVGKIRNLKILNTSKDKTVAFNSTYGALPSPTRANYTFDGWYTAASGGTEKTSSSTYTTVGNSTLYAHWTPASVTHRVYLRVISKDGNTVNASNAGGSVSVTRNVISGETSSPSTTTQTSTEGTYASHQGQEFKLVASAKAGYVFAGFSTSSTPSASIKQPSSPPSNTFTAYPASGTTYYVYFKQMSPNTLKYDETDKYFYFEDGYYPQGEATGRQTNTLNEALANGASASESFVYNDGTKSVEVPVYALNGNRYALVNGYGTRSAEWIGNGSNCYYIGKEKGYIDFITINLWAYKDNWNVSDQQAMISWTNYGGWNLYVNPDDVRGYAGAEFMKHGENSYRTIKFAKLTDLTSGWHMFTFTFDGRYAKAYTDGVLTDTSDLGEGASLKPETEGRNIVVGAECGSASESPDGNYFSGKIKNVEIKNLCLTARNILELCESGTYDSWFKFEPIRWRISDYGVEKSERNLERYTNLYNLRNYTSYATNFTAVSDLILGVGAMHDSRQTSEGMSVTAMKGFQFVEEMTNSMALNNHYAKSGNVIKVDSYSTVSQGNPTTTTSYAYSSAIRIASLEDISEVGLLNRQARASDMVAFILGLDKDEVSYWTRDLSNLGSGIAITASGTQVRPWLDQMMGMRFAYTFSEGSNASFY